LVRTPSASIPSRSIRGSTSGGPRVVFIRKVIGGPLSEDLRLELATIRRHLDATFIGASSTRPRWSEGVLRLPDLRPRFLGGLLFYPMAALIGVCLAGRRGGIVCWSVLEGLPVVALCRMVPTRIRPSVTVEIHGDWRSGLRLYGHPARRLVAPVVDRLTSWTLTRADRVRVVSDSTEQLAVKSGVRGKLDKYVHFSNISMFMSTESEPLPAERQFAFVGALERIKGVDVLIEAWCRVAPHIQGVRLVVAGTGTLNASVERMIDRCGLSESVQLVGALSRAAVRDLMDRSSCVIVPSRSEGLGMVIVEAMARGRPVVASEVGGVPELVEHGLNGLLVPPGQAEELARAMLALIRDPARLQRMSTAARERALLSNRDDEFEAGIVSLRDWLGSQ
jgi:glycosyltransferase involved in cell wall biosynthesis